MSKRQQIALLIGAAILAIAAVGVAYSVYIVQPQRQVIDLMHTEQAAGGLTAVYEFELTRQFQR